MIDSFYFVCSLNTLGPINGPMPMWGCAGLALLLFVSLPAVIAEAQRTEADVYVGQAIVDFDDKRYDSALDNLRRALEVEPDHVQALYYTGVVYMAQRQPARAVPFLERARARVPNDSVVAFQLGLAYFAQERYDRAEPLLDEAFRGQPNLDGLGYYVGFLRYRRKDYRGALQAFRGSRTMDPEIQQLTRLYTGLSLAAMGLPGQATSEVEQAIRLAPGSAITGPAERLRDAVVTAQATERRFSGEVRVGLLYDDNPRVRPKSVVGNGDSNADPLVTTLRGQSRQSIDSVGELVGLRGDYVWWRTPQWESSISYSGFLTYENDVPKFSVLDHLVAASLLHKNTVAGMPIQTGLQYVYDAVFLGGPIFLQRQTASLFGSLVENEHHLTQAFGRYQRKDFNQRVLTSREEIRDADNWMAGFQHFLRFSEDRHYLKLGYQFDWENADGNDWGYHGNRILAGGQVTLPWKGTRLKYDFDLHLRDYTFKNTILPSNNPGRERRFDEEFNHAFRVEVPLGTLKVGSRDTGLTFVLEYLMTNNHSNLDVFSYRRNVTSASVAWSF